MIVDMGLSFFAPSSLSKNAGSFEGEEREMRWKTEDRGGICSLLGGEIELREREKVGGMFVN